MSAFATSHCVVREHLYSQSKMGAWKLTSATSNLWDIEAGVDDLGDMQCVNSFDEFRNKGFCYSVIVRNGNFYWFTKSGNRGTFGPFTEQPVPQDKYTAWLNQELLTAVIEEGKMKVVLQVSSCR